jgi:hypothetical protein
MNQTTPHVFPPAAARPHQFHSITVTVAVVAATATFITLSAALPAWAMFLGWVGYSTSGQSTREGIGNLVSFLLGIALGAGTALAIGWLSPYLGDMATPVAVFGDVLIVLSLRALPPINNPLAYFLGLISFFASAQAPSPILLAMLAAAGVIGATGAGLAAYLQGRIEPQP